MASALFSSPASTSIFLFLFLFLSLLTCISSLDNLHPKPNRNNNEEHLNLNSPILKSKPPQKKPFSQSLTNKTKSLKSNNSTISSLIPPTKKTKSLKSNSTISPTNKTNSLKPKKSNSTIPLIPPTNKSKLNKTLTPNINKSLKSPNPPPKNPNRTYPKSSLETWINEDEDIMSEFRDLPSRLHSAIVPDLHKLSATSKLYLSKTHREIAAGVKPYVGKRYAPSIASAASAALLLLPLFLVTALFRCILRTGSSASLYRAILFVQAYLAIYFATLSLTAVVTGLEPLRFFHAASPGAYAWTQAVQTLGYVVYLIAQLIGLVVAFSAGEGELAAGKAVSLAQMLLGLAVGMHYYITVFHRAVTGEAPRANWKVHGIYAACFLVICGLGRADRRKKSYIQEDGGDDGKKS